MLLFFFFFSFKGHGQNIILKQPKIELIFRNLKSYYYLHHLYDCMYILHLNISGRQTV